MTELGVKGAVCGIGGSMGLEVLDSTEKQASRGPGGEGRKREWIPGVSVWPVNTPVPIRCLGAQMKWELISFGGISRIKA